MLDSSNSSLFDASREWKERADDALRVSLGRLYQSSRVATGSRRNSISRLMAQVKKKVPSEAEINKDLENQEKKRKKWAATQVEEINKEADKEMRNLYRLKAQQQQIFQTQLTEKNDIWEKVVIERRQEAARLRAQITKLSTEIAVARNNAKDEINKAKKQENENLRAIRNQRERLINQVNDLTATLHREKTVYECETKLSASSSSTSLNQKSDQLQRLKVQLDMLKGRQGSLDSDSQSTLADQIVRIQGLSEKLQEIKEEEKSKQRELMEMKKACASMARRVCAHKDEAASLQRQITMIKKENARLEAEIDKMDKNVPPSLRQLL